MSDFRSRYVGSVISIGGPPHSGKSVFVAELYRRLLVNHNGNVFLERVSPDGEGQWYSETDPSHAQKLRKKQSFSQEYLEKKYRAVENLGQNFRIVLVDLGGKLGDDIPEFFLRSTHCILLSSSSSELAQWEKVATHSNCTILARFSSRLIPELSDPHSSSAISTVQCQSLPWTGELINLVRGETCTPYNESISDIANALEKLFL
jgi:CRISPR-associated protein Csx3